MSFIVKFDSTENFWELHPQFKMKFPFNELYKNDLSKKKDKSSLIMWFIAFCYDVDPRNIFRNAPIEEKHEVVGKDFCADSKYFNNNQSSLEKLIPYYIEIALTPEERHYTQWVELLEERGKFLKTQKYNLENFESLDKMAASTEKLIGTLKKIKESVSMEQKAKGSAKGDKELSLTDLGEI